MQLPGPRPPLSGEETERRTPISQSSADPDCNCQHSDAVITRAQRRTPSAANFTCARIFLAEEKPRQLATRAIVISVRETGPIEIGGSQVWLLILACPLELTPTCTDGQSPGNTAFKQTRQRLPKFRFADRAGEATSARIRTRPLGQTLH